MHLNRPGTPGQLLLLLLLGLLLLLYCMPQTICKWVAVN